MLSPIANAITHGTSIGTQSCSIGKHPVLLKCTLSDGNNAKYLATLRNDAKRDRPSDDKGRAAAGNSQEWPPLLPKASVQLLRQRLTTTLEARMQPMCTSDTQSGEASSSNTGPILSTGGPDASCSLNLKQEPSCHTAQAAEGGPRDSWIPSSRRAMSSGTTSGISSQAAESETTLAVGPSD